MTELAIQREIMLAASTPTRRLFRNNVGSLEDKRGQWVRFGLAVGSSDLIGLTSVTITPEMVGRRIAVFTAIEVKHEAPVTSDQLAFIKTVLAMGGIAGVAHSVADYDTIVAQYKPPA